MKTPYRKSARNHYATDTAKWQAVAERNPNADGKFYFAVTTTGVYCRPSCSARRALRRNVVYFTTPEEAERTGFRACKRCQPGGRALDAEYRAAITRACRAIETQGQMPSLAEIAKIAGLSPYHFHRIFKMTTGVTPKAYAMAHRSQRVRQSLLQRRTVTEAIYEAGFGSIGRFYENSNERLGMKPTKFRNGGVDTKIRFAVGKCSLGSVLVAASQKGVCAITLGNDPDALVKDLQDRFPKAVIIGADAGFERLVARVVGLIETPRADPGLPLDIRGTAFQQRVWQALRKIPLGSTVSYSEIAKRIGQPKSVRAVAGAIAANAIAVAIPCHRVLHRDGTLSGYRWGVERKRALLRMETAKTPQASS